jgi:hypothetical protein
MLEIVAALSLLAAGQAKLSDTQAQEPQAPAAAPAPAPAPAPETPAAAPAAEPRAATPPAEAPQLVSLISAETLHGGSAALGWVGWPSFGASWGQGITDKDDAGALFQLDWASTELLLGAWYRRALGNAGPFLMSGRLGVSYYANFDGEMIYSDNRSAQGVQFAPSLLLSTRGAGGIFSISGDLPMTVTFSGSGGFLFQPRVTAAYETLLFDQMSLGVRGGVGYRVGSDDAPMKEGRADLELVVLVGYRIF